MSFSPESTGAVSVGELTTVTFLPSGQTISVEAGITVIQAARKAGVEIDAPCNEQKRCGKCRVKIIEGEVGDATAEDIALLKPDELEAGVRLACATKVNWPLVVQVPESSRNLAHRKASADLQRPITADPFTRKICVKVAAPSISTADLRDDLTRLKEALPQIKTVHLEAVRELHTVLVEGNYTVTALLAGDRLIAVEPGDTSTMHYGLALDIGTTTLVGYLINLNTGEEVAVSPRPNPQASYGGDVISRIEFVQGNSEKIEILRQCVAGAVNEILHSVTASAGISAQNICQVVVVGNTCMTHLFLGIDPISLGHAPYTPVITDSMTVAAADLGLAMHQRGIVRTLPNIAGFVGADTVGVLAASDLEKRTGLNVAVDIGTNAEVIASLDGKVTACSTAAGPAFEGAKISQGMRAQPGAIDGVTIGQDIFSHTIDDIPALGICGSGIIDAIGELLRTGMLDSAGRFTDADELSHLPEALRSRIVDDGVVLAWASENGAGRDIILTQHDVREIQLVKGAIYAGIATMLEKIGHTPEELDALLIAGAFGTFITKEHALGIGLIPNISLDKLIFLGNAAGIGAKMALISQPEFNNICAAASRVGYVELAGDPSFSNHFMISMTLAPGCED